jgi:hypothetical protein
MEKIRQRVKELMLKGLHCAQIMLLLSQDLREEDEPAVIRAMGGLTSGLYMGLNCAAMSGGCCLIASYLSRGGEDDDDVGTYKAMVVKLVDWFNSRFGAINCLELVSADRSERLEKCSEFISETFMKCLEILEENNIDPRS